MPIACGPEGLPAVVFMENQKFSDTVQNEEIGSLEILQQTKVSQSIAEGKGLNEALAGHQAQFNQIKASSLFGKHGSSVGMFDIPWGVAVSDRDEIAVTDMQNHRVQLLIDSSGKYLNTKTRYKRDSSSPSLSRNRCFNDFSKDGGPREQEGKKRHPL